MVLVVKFTYYVLQFKMYSPKHNSYNVFIELKLWRSKFKLKVEVTWFWYFTYPPPPSPAILHHMIIILPGLDKLSIWFKSYVWDTNHFRLCFITNTVGKRNKPKKLKYTQITNMYVWLICVIRYLHLHLLTYLVLHPSSCWLTKQKIKDRSFGNSEVPYFFLWKILKLYSFQVSRY